MQFIKTSQGLSEVDRAKIRIYDTIEEAELALANGEITEGEVVGTRYNESGDFTLLIQAIADDVSTIQSYIPSDTDATTNTLVNKEMLEEATGGVIEVQCSGTAVCNISSDNPLNLNSIAFDGVDISDKVTCSDYQQFQIDITDSLNCGLCCRVQCCDYNVDKTAIENRLTSLESCGGLTCVGDVTTSTLNSCVSDLNTDISGRVTCTDYQNAITNIDSNILDLKSCSGLDCVGTVTSVNNCSPDNNGNVQITLPTYSLSGTTLTITV